MNLKSIRKNKNISVSTLSKMATVPVRTIEDIERNGNCKIHTAIKLAEALEVTLDELCIDKKTK